MAGPRAYRSAVREAQAEANRRRVVDAAYRLLKTTRPVDLSYADVAETAGVSVRTVYRNFPRADDLFAAVAQEVLPPALREGRRPETLADLIEALEHSFARL
jgi:AcrR family transcriptional regulator